MTSLLYRLLWQPIGDLLFPKFCTACDRHITAGETILCLECRHTLPFTNMENIAENEAHIKFLTKLPLIHAAALLYFVEEGMVREMMHRLKYQGRPEVGRFLGILLAKKFSTTDWFNTIDGIVPVPLHHKKQNKRGYNQAEMISVGISEITGKPVWGKAVLRTRNTASQTRKSSKDRQENVRNAFEVRAREQLNNKHILLVDDVLTTGATLASCGNAIVSACSCSLSLATVAMARH